MNPQRHLSVKQPIERPLTRSQLLLTSNTKRNPVMQVEKSLQNWKKDLEQKPLFRQKGRLVKPDLDDESEDNSTFSQQMHTSDEGEMLELRSNQTDRASKDDSILDVDEVVTPKKRKKGQSKTDAKTKEKAKPKHNVRAAFERAKACRQTQANKTRRGESLKFKHADSETDIDLKKAHSPLTTFNPEVDGKFNRGSEAIQIKLPIEARMGVENSITGTRSQLGDMASSIKATSDIAKSQTQAKAATIIKQLVEEKLKWGVKSARGRGQEFGSPIPNRVPTVTDFSLRDQTAIRPPALAQPNNNPRLKYIYHLAVKSDSPISMIPRSSADILVKLKLGDPLGSAEIILDEESVDKPVQATPQGGLVSLTEALQTICGSGNSVRSVVKSVAPGLLYDTKIPELEQGDSQQQGSTKKISLIGLEILTTPETKEATPLLANKAFGPEKGYPSLSPGMLEQLGAPGLIKEQCEDVEKTVSMLFSSMNKPQLLQSLQPPPKGRTDEEISISD